MGIRIMFQSIALRRLIKFGRRTSADLAGKAVHLTNPHRRSVDRERRPAFLLPPCAGSAQPRRSGRRRRRAR